MANQSFDGTTGGLYQDASENKNNFPDYNFGADGILKIKDWLRVKAELHYSNLGFTAIGTQTSRTQEQEILKEFKNRKLLLVTWISVLKLIMILKLEF